MDGNWIYHGDHFEMYKKIKSLWCIPKTNKIFYINYTLIKLINKRKQAGNESQNKLNK